MKSLIKTGSEILASLMIMALVMLNLQVGVDGDVESSALDTIGLATTVNTAKAGNCDPGSSKCSVYVFPDGKKYWEYGKVVVVTPRKNSL